MIGSNLFVIYLLIDTFYRSFDEGEEAARMIEEQGETDRQTGNYYVLASMQLWFLQREEEILCIKNICVGKFETCLIEISNKGPWMLHKDGDKASLDKVKISVA